MNWLKKLFGGAKKANEKPLPTTPTTEMKEHQQEMAEALKALFTHGKFEPVSTQSPEEAVEVLFEQALPAAPNASPETVQRWYESLRDSWSSQKLAKGSRKQIKSIVLANLRRIRSEPNFREFTVKVYLEHSAAQVEAIVPPYFMPIRVWRSEDSYFACGNSDFK